MKSFLNSELVCHESNIVFIQNVHLVISETALTKYLSFWNPLQVFIPYKIYAGHRNKRYKDPMGCAIVVLDSIDTAKNMIINLQDVLLLGRHLKLSYHIPYTPTENWIQKKRYGDLSQKLISQSDISRDTIYISRLNKLVTDDILRSHFQEYTPTEIWIYKSAEKVKYLPNSKKITISALVTVQSEKSIDDIIKLMNKKKLMGKKIEMRPALIAKIEQLKNVTKKEGVTNREATILSAMVNANANNANNLEANGNAVNNILESLLPEGSSRYNTGGNIDETEPYGNINANGNNIDTEFITNDQDEAHENTVETTQGSTDITSENITENSSRNVDQQEVPLEEQAANDEFSTLIPKIQPFCPYRKPYTVDESLVCH